MIRFFQSITVLALALAAGGAAAEPPRMALGAGPRTGDVYVVEVPVSSADAAAELARREFNIASIRENRAEIYAVREELELLDALGYSWHVIRRDGDGTKALGEYNGYASVTAMLAAYAQAYPAITRLESVGQSVEGRELWVLYISDNPGIEEDEPEFKYIGTIHGDEPLGTEMCLHFIDLLLTGYGQIPRITDLVDNTSIAILPLLNPDGREAGTRMNANGVDLNRAFPRYPFDYTGNQGDGEPLQAAGRQPEVVRVMEWTAANRFVLSANFHTGALLVNYPYDEDGVPSGADAPTPDDALFQELARRYARENLPMWNSPYFADGISNGSAWYSIFGSMQDWNYRYMACNEVTIELSNTKWPPAGALPAFWDDNREAMLRYLEAVHLGVRGLVTDALTGQPLDARVTVQGNAQPVFTDPDVGDYHRTLLPGVYTITIRANGYYPQTFINLIVTSGPATRIDAALIPLDAPFDADVNNDGEVNAIDVQLVINAALGLSVPAGADINADGAVDAIDIQLVINAALTRSYAPATAQE
ncbi:MAG TPA: M14 family zinc carboxypeptidase [Candidatus Hydrogenedentes bacterium]|nr:M14 family zinc carboxypeptidase [Candidatus Hydrogenedentota bacterium]